MDLKRRDFLKLALGAALGPLLVTPRQVTASAAVAAPALRPEPAASSAAVCARCGAPDHHMLSPHCPGAAITAKAPDPAWWLTVASTEASGATEAAL